MKKTSKTYGKYIILIVVICLIAVWGFRMLQKGKSDGKGQGGLVVSDALKGSGDKEDATAATVTEEPQQTAEPEVSATPQQTEPAKNEDGYAQLISHEKMKLYDDTGTVMVGDTGYEIYNYVPSVASNYAKAINKAGKAIGNTAKVYDVLIPTSVGITLPDNKKDKVNSSDQKDSIDKLTKKIKAPVQTISLYDVMMQHRQEYIYYRTDHHWTHKGAYYGYVGICQALGLTPHALSEYKKANFGSFIGTYYSDTHQNNKLRKDSVAAYYPVNNKKMTLQYGDKSKTKYKVIQNSSKFGISGKYLAFLGGDNAYSVVENKAVKDGSSCVVVKESFGNALVPYLADHYSKVYVIDYRYWNGSLSKLVKKKKAKDVFFLNNISMTRNAYLIGKLAGIAS